MPFSLPKLNQEYIARDSFSNKAERKKNDLLR